jgi:hypothetical protein
MSSPLDSSPTTFGTTSARQLVSCRVCGRTLLMGERSVGFFTVSGEGPYDVCQLCVSRAHRYGLRPRPSTADEIARARGGNAVSRLLDATRSLVGARGARKRARPAAPEAHGTAAVTAAAAAAASGSGKRSRRRAVAAAPLDPFALGAVPVGSAAIPVGLAAFNQSPHARTLAGLYRTLGAPRASVAPRSATDREVILTVAWEIVWYQFRVMPDGIEQQRGQYLSELQPRWQQWNCDVNVDGTIRERGEPGGTFGHDVADPTSPEAPTR